MRLEILQRLERSLLWSQYKNLGLALQEPIPLEDKDEQVDYGHDDIDAYLTELEDACDLGDVGGLDDDSDFGIASEEMLTSLSLSGGSKSVTDF
ncbi:uncharacterized protein A4U43_C01F22210 [Asparagus officinalis]|uniref:Uncharacterized protein n=1 Tax=Asparagus officinalis TaxID=4686 RepID=A0A5P1FTS3_ASPOF|nr:uncharacterized protein A4U43_C01F22210 [Asparagus officinalis]